MNSKTISIYKKLYKNNKYILFWAFLFGILSTLINIYLIDTISVIINGTAPFDINELGVLLVMCVLLFVFVSGSQILFDKLGNHIVFHLMTELSQRVLNTPLEQIHKIGKAKIIATLINDTDSISDAFVGLPFVVFGVSIALAGFVYLGSLSLPLFLALFVILVITVIIAVRLINKTDLYMEMEREVEDEVYAAFHAVAEGQNEFKLNIYRHIDFTKNELIPPIDKSRKFANKAIVFISLTEGLAESATVFMMVFIIALHFIFGIGSFEHLTTFALVILFLRPPISGLLTSFPALIQGKVAVEKIASLKLSGSTKLPSPPNVDFEQWQSISMKEVEYYYPDSGGERGFHIGPIDLNINRGEVVFIVGGNGSGKSTLAKLLTGLYQPSSGSVTLNTSSGDDINMEAYRHHFSIVLSDFFLFKRLLGANGEKTTTEKVGNYLQLFKLDKKVKVNDDTLSTIDLSQGQRKRLALMAAFLEDKPIILLDEWAADQDPIFRRLFYRELLPELKRKGKTIIAITHDEHYFDLADHILRVNNGVVEKLNYFK